MGRNIKDAQMIKTIALPAAAANVNTAAIDLGATAGIGSIRPVEECEFQISVPATPSLVDAKTITFTIQDSADNSAFAALAASPSFVVTGAGGVGAAAATFTFRLPSSTRRYVAANAAVLTAGGSNIAVSFTFQALM